MGSEELGRGPFGLEQCIKGVLYRSRQPGYHSCEEKVVGEAEMTMIGRTHHRNLVRLLGFCMQGPSCL